MSNLHHISFVYEWEDPFDQDAEPVEIEIEAALTPYYRAVMYLRNGDPGYPAEGGEVEELSGTWPDGTSVDLESTFGWTREYDEKTRKSVRAVRPLSVILEERAFDESQSQ